MNPKKIFVLTMASLVATFLISLAPAFCQVDTAWVRRYATGYSDVARAIAVGDSGYVYVTGTAGTIDGDYVTVKYDSDGDSVWLRSYDGPAGDYDLARAIAVDSCGNVYVTGESWNGGKWRSDYATIKYYPNGQTAWVRRYNGPAPEDCLDGAYAIAVDDSSNVYVTGWSDFSLHQPDYATIKYRSDGAELWVRRYNASEPGHLSDGAFALAIDDSGYIYVTGASSVDVTGYDYATIKYYPNGDTAWVRRYDGPGNSIDEALATTVDDSGNVYVTGFSAQSSYPYNYDYATIKYYPNGATAWVRRYNGPGNGDDEAYALAVDGPGNVYVTGFSAQSSSDPYNFDYATIKYLPNGNVAPGWPRRYNGPGNADDYANAIAVDGPGNAYVTGYSYGSGTYDDYATIRYDSLGNELWVERYNGPGNFDDVAYAIAVDDSNNIYVTGGSDGIGTNSDYATIKYVQTQLSSVTLSSPNGGEIWQAGHQYYITWSSQDSAGYGRIDYSINSGASFDSLIVASCPNTGEYLWTVPCRTTSDHCRVRVCDAVDYNPADSSDSDFTIIYICGDVNCDGTVSSADIVYLINYLFIGGPAPCQPYSADRGDVNKDGVISSADIVYLINYLFIGGPAPKCPGFAR